MSRPKTRAKLAHRKLARQEKAKTMKETASKLTLVQKLEKALTKGLGETNEVIRYKRLLNM